LVGIAVLAGVALCVAAYTLGTGTTTVTLMAVALIALALAQGISVLRSHMQSDKLIRVAESQLSFTETALRIASDQQRVNIENINLVRNFEQFRHETTEHNAGLSEGLAQLRHGHESVADNLKSILESQREILTRVPLTRESRTVLDHAITREQSWVDRQLPPVEEPEQAEPEPETPSAQGFENTQLGESLSLALEPIIDLYTSSTAHYRMVLGMTNEHGQDVPHDVFVHYADSMGLRAQLDRHVVEQALGLLVQLRQRDEGLCIFVPVGSATLADHDAVASIVELLQSNPDTAQGIVLDVPHAILASLSESSLEGLATLARSGVVLSLSQASIAGVDLGALNRLNVRYVGLAASSIGVGAVVSAGLPGFVQSARALRIQAVISHVTNPRHVPGLARISRYACGPAFAHPRKLKRAATDQQSYTAAA
jgi:EAL domain-containing protein (putative c-di-GMP-specific phosphodiesterase class I)